MTTLLGIPILGFLIILQSTVVSRLSLLEGSADLMMLTVVAWALQERVRSSWQWAVIAGALVSLVSALPFYLVFTGFLLVTLIARLLQRQVWQTPILAMFIMSFLGTLIFHGLTIAGIAFTGTMLPVQDSLTLVTLPSALLNLIFALPVYIVVGDLANWVYPQENL